MAPVFVEKNGGDSDKTWLVLTYVGLPQVDLTAANLRSNIGRYNKIQLQAACEAARQRRRLEKTVV